MSWINNIKHKYYQKEMNTFCKKKMMLKFSINIRKCFNEFDHIAGVRNTQSKSKFQ